MPSSRSLGVSVNSESKSAAFSEPGPRACATARSAASPKQASAAAVATTKSARSVTVRKVPTTAVTMHPAPGIAASQG